MNYEKQFNIISAKLAIKLQNFCAENKPAFFGQCSVLDEILRGQVKTFKYLGCEDFHKLWGRGQ